MTLLAWPERLRAQRRQVTFRRLAWAAIGRDVRISLSYRTGFLLSIPRMLLSLALFLGLSRVVGDGSHTQFGGGRSYFAFAVVGLMLLHVAQAALGSHASRLRNEQVTGTLEILLSGPAPAWKLVLADSAYDMLQAGVGALVILLLALTVFGLRLQAAASDIAVAAAAFAGSLVFVVALGLALAGFTVVFKQAGAIHGFAVTGIALLGGVWFPIAVLPSWLQRLSDALPFSWGLRVLRQALLGGGVELRLLAALAAADVVCLAAGVVLLEYAIASARRRGSLGQY